MQAYCYGVILGDFGRYAGVLPVLVLIYCYCCQEMIKVNARDDGNTMNSQTRKGKHMHIFVIVSHLYFQTKIKTNV